MLGETGAKAYSALEDKCKESGFALMDLVNILKSLLEQVQQIRRIQCNNKKLIIQRNFGLPIKDMTNKSDNTDSDNDSNENNNKNIKQNYSIHNGGSNEYSLKFSDKKKSENVKTNIITTS